MTEDEYQAKLKEIELEIKKVELDRARLELSLKNTIWTALTSPTVVTAITAVLGLFGAVLTNYFQQEANLKVEKQKNQAELITRSISTGDPESSAKNLIFLLDLGLIQDTQGKIEKLRTKPADAPTLPAPSESKSLKLSSRSLDSLQPKVSELAQKLIIKAKEQGIDVIVLRTFTSKEEQEELYARGVTKMRGGKSLHNFGLAFDIAPVKDGKADFSDIELYKKLGEIGKGLGLTWGGDWKSFKDYPHFELKQSVDSESESNISTSIGGSSTSIERDAQKAVRPSL